MCLPSDKLGNEEEWRMYGTLVRVVEGMLLVYFERTNRLMVLWGVFAGAMCGIDFEPICYEQACGWGAEETAKKCRRDGRVVPDPIARACHDFCLSRPSESPVQSILLGGAFSDIFCLRRVHLSLPSCAYPPRVLLLLTPGCVTLNPRISTTVLIYTSTTGRTARAAYRICWARSAPRLTSPAAMVSQVRGNS